MQGEVEICTSSSSELPDPFYLNQRVQVQYKGKWYDGTYCRERYRTTKYGVQCDSDKKGVITWAKEDGVRAIPHKEGDSVYVEYDGEWYEGSIESVHDEGTAYTVMCTESNKKMVKFPSERVRVEKPKKKSNRWDDGDSWSSWKREPVVKPLTKLSDVPSWPEVYDKIKKSGGPPQSPVKLEILYKDSYGDLEKKKVVPSKARPIQFLDPRSAVGMKVGALWSAVDRRIYGAKVTKVHSDGTLDLLYNDGDTKEGVKPHRITFKEFAHDYTGDPFDAEAFLAQAKPQQTKLMYRMRDYPKDRWTVATFLGVDKPMEMEKLKVNKSFNDIVTLWKGDITELGVDAIQNAANSSLWAGGGICGAIHDAAGSELQDACEKFPEVSGADDDDEEEEEEDNANSGWGGGGGGWGGGWEMMGGWKKKKKRKARCPTGETRVTKGFKLHAKHVLHTVGPTSHDEPALERAYISALDASNKNGFSSIALCCVSTGIYGFPSEAACPLALRTTRQWLQKNAGKHSLKKIIFCVFTGKDTELYQIYMPIFFPCE